VPNQKATAVQMDGRSFGVDDEGNEQWVWLAVMPEHAQSDPLCRWVTVNCSLGSTL